MRRQKMRGFPKHLNTKQDFINLKTQYPAETKAALQTLLDDRMQWLKTADLDESDPGLEDETHKIVIDTDESDNEIRYQYEYMEDPAARIFHLGFTVEEAEAMIGGK